MSKCPGCDGSGFYTPQFSPDVLVNCLSCNEDWSKGAGEWTECDDCSGTGADMAFSLHPLAMPDGADCPSCEGTGLRRSPQANDAPTPAAHEMRRAGAMPLPGLEGV